MISSIQRTLTIDERKYIGPRYEKRCEEASHKREIVAAQRADRMGFVFAGDAPAATKDFSCLVSRRIVIAYWLIPTEPARSSFRSLINKLALRYNAPQFEPHVTVHVGANCRDVVDGVSAAARHCEPIVLRALEVSSSTEFIKTLFVQFALNRQLQRLNQSIRNAAQDSSDYQLNPHLSLLYKTISTQDRRLLTHSIDVPFPEVTFDSLKAVRCVSPTQSRADVEAWHVVAEKPLGSIGV